MYGLPIHHTHSGAAPPCDDHRPCIAAPGPLWWTRLLALACLPLWSGRVASSKQYLLLVITPTPTPTPTPRRRRRRPSDPASRLARPFDSCIPPVGVAPRPHTLELTGHGGPRPQLDQRHPATLADLETHARRLPSTHVAGQLIDESAPKLPPAACMVARFLTPPPSRKRA